MQTFFPAVLKNSLIPFLLDDTTLKYVLVIELKMN